jgi:hypothetical protein
MAAAAAGPSGPLILRDLMIQAIKYAAKGKIVEWEEIFVQISRM